MNNKRRVLVIVLILLTIVLGGASIFISLQLQQNVSPSDSDASGFGPNASRDLYSNVVEEFKATPCNFILSGKYLLEGTPEPLETFMGKDIPFTVEPRLDSIPMFCKFQVGSLERIYFEVRGYDEFSYIDNSPTELFQRINSKWLASQEDSGYYDGVNYFFGKDAFDATRCRMNLFQVDNDFEFATVVYEKFGSDCASLKELNRAVAQSVSSQITAVLVGVNSKYKQVESSQNAGQE